MGERKLGKWLAVCFQTYTWQSLLFTLRQRSCCGKIRIDGPCKIVQLHSSKQEFGRMFQQESISEYNQRVLNHSRIEYRCLNFQEGHIFQCARPASINVALHRWRLSNHKRHDRRSNKRNLLVDRMPFCECTWKFGAEHQSCKRNFDPLQ